MSRRWFALAAFPALVAAGLMLFADQAQAQLFRGRGLGFGIGSGYGYGRGLGFGLGSGYGYGYPYSGGYGWSSYPAYGWGNNYYSPWMGNRYYSGAYSTYPSTWESSWNYPSGTYYNNVMPSSNYYGFQPSYDYSGMNSANFDNGMNMQNGYTSFYSNDQFRHENIPDTAALISMRLPPHAKVWFSGDETKSQGAFRQYVTPSLDKGKVFYYEIRARWNEGGRDIDRTHRVLVHAGDRINVDLMRDMTNVDEMTPEHLRQRENVRPAEGTRSERRFYEEDRNGERVNPPTDNANPVINNTINNQAAPANNARPSTTTNVTPDNPGGTSGTQPRTNTTNTNRPPQ